jgi:hypothetical protein
MNKELRSNLLDSSNEMGSTYPCRSLSVNEVVIMVDEDVLLPVPVGSGSSRCSSKFRQHDGVMTLVVEKFLQGLP